MAATKYTALTPIEHNGKNYAEGAPITLEPQHAEPLLALKAIKLQAKAGGSDKGQTEAEIEAARREAEERARAEAEAAEAARRAAGGA